MRTKFLAPMLLSLAFVCFSCSKEMPVDPVVMQESNVISRSGEANGVAYSLNNLALNPDVIVLNADNSTLSGSVGELAEGIVKIETDIHLSEDDVLYIRSGEYTGLRKISSVSQISSGKYLLETTSAQLGELFQGGNIELSLDIQQMTRAAWGFDESYVIIDAMDEYNWEGLTYNPSTNVRLALNMQMEFSKWQLLPSKFSTYFEITPTLNPYISSKGALNNVYTNDISELIPAEVIDFLEQREFQIDIPINTLGIESIPATLRIDDIKMPTRIEANLSGQTDFSFSVGGSYKAGYAIDIAGFKATVKPIYENNITSNISNVAASMPGELLTNAEIVITPSISVLDDLYTISGDIVFGLKTENGGSVNLKDAPSFSSKGTMTSRMTILVDLILTKVPVDLFNNGRELWGVGSLDKTVVYSDLSWKVGSKYSTNILLLSRMYETDFTLKYAYPILGKKIPDQLFISYEVYQDNGTTRIQSVKDQAIAPTDITDGSFKFKLSIPYKSKLLSYQTTSYLKNIVIRDANGYEYEGIFNSGKGVKENSFAIKR